MDMYRGCVGLFQYNLFSSLGRSVSLLLCSIDSIHHNLDLLWSCGSLGCCDLIILWLILLVCCRGKRRSVLLYSLICILKFSVIHWLISWPLHLCRCTCICLILNFDNIHQFCFHNL